MNFLTILIEREAKYCPSCEQTYPVTEFSRRNHGDGYQTYCKKCQTEKVKESYSTPEGAERRREYLREYRRRPENQVHCKLRHDDYYERNKERIKEQNRLSMQKAYQDPEKRAKKQAANREYHRKKREAAKAAKANETGT